MRNGSHCRPTFCVLKELLPTNTFVLRSHIIEDMFFDVERTGYQPCAPKITDLESCYELVPNDIKKTKKRMIENCNMHRSYKRELYTISFLNHNI